MIRASALHCIQAPLLSFLQVDQRGVAQKTGVSCQWLKVKLQLMCRKTFHGHFSKQYILNVNHIVASCFINQFSLKSIHWLSHRYDLSVSSLIFFCATNLNYAHTNLANTCPIDIGVSNGYFRLTLEKVAGRTLPLKWPLKKHTGTNLQDSTMENSNFC